MQYHQDIWFVCCVSSPVGYFSRFKLYRDFAKHVLCDLKVNLVTCECAYGDHPHMLQDEVREYETEDVKLYHIPVRSNSRIWHKENLLNIAIKSIPDHVKYVCWCDADIEFLNGDETIPSIINALQRNAIVQCFSVALDIGPAGNVIGIDNSFAKSYANGIKSDVCTTRETWFQTGYTWAARLDAIRSIGGLFDLSIIGGGDHIIASCIVGDAHKCIADDRYSECSDEFKQAICKFEKKLLRHTHGWIAHVPLVIKHHFHGHKCHRNYELRHKILFDYQYKPSDLEINEQGVYELVDGKDDLQDDIIKYFRSRKEDCHHE